MQMRERIARAAFPYSWIELDEGRSKAGSGDHHDSMRDMSLQRADAVLDAMREPDEAMVDAGNRNATVEIAWSCAWSEDSYCETSAEPFDDARNVWQAMIDFARTPPEGA